MDSTQLRQAQQLGRIYRRVVSLLRQTTEAPGGSMGSQTRRCEKCAGPVFLALIGGKMPWLYCPRCDG